MAPTHFLCLPLITPTSRPQLEASLRHLRSQTSALDENKISDSAYTPLGVLHLTLGVMNLSSMDGSRARLDAALQLLRDTDLEILLQWAGSRPRTSVKVDLGDAHAGSALATQKRTISPPRKEITSAKAIPPLEFSLVGLSAFPEMRKATVLHAKPHDPTDRLYYFCLALRQNFIDAGFLEPEERPMVLHATIVNTVYSKSSRERKGENGRGMGRIAMDARELVQRFNEDGGIDGKREGKRGSGSFVWAEGVVAESVRICKMGARRVEDQGLGMEYEVVAEKRVFEEQ